MKYDYRPKTIKLLIDSGAENLTANYGRNVFEESCLENKIEILNLIKTKTVLKNTFTFYPLKSSKKCRLKVKSFKSILCYYCDLLAPLMRFFSENSGHSSLAEKKPLNALLWGGIHY